MSKESASDVRRQGWRNGGTNQKTDRGRDKDKHDGGSNLEMVEKQVGGRAL